MSTIKQLRNQTGMSQRQFANYLAIPIKNIQQWEQELRHPPEYVTHMIERILRLEKIIDPAHQHERRSPDHEQDK